MPTLRIPNDASIHTLNNFLTRNNPFSDQSTDALLQLHPNWAYMDLMALAIAAAWGGWCQRNGKQVSVQGTVGPHTNYAARMRLFSHLHVGYDVRLEEHEEAGRFVPLTQVKTYTELSAVIADVSALLHLDQEPNGLAAVRYCVSELIRNVLEHSASPEGAYVCAQRYSKKEPRRVSIAVADCGLGIQQHLGREYPKALEDSLEALRLAMQPGVTGAQRGVYGSPDNAGAGLFITRAIARATGGYFVLLSGRAAFRLRRSKGSEQLVLPFDPFEEQRADRWRLDNTWQGTVAAAEIMTDKVRNFPDLFQWIRKQLPGRKTVSRKIKFT